MMKIILLLLSGIVLISFAPSTKLCSINLEKYTVSYTKEKGRYSGEYKSNYTSTGKTRATGTLLNGKRVGEWIVYDSIENILVKRNYLNKDTFHPKLKANEDLEYITQKGAPLTTLYSKRLWRILPRQNNEALFNGSLLAGSLLKMASNNQIKTYSPVSDELEYFLSYDSLRYVYKEVVAFKIKEDNYYNKYTQLMETKIIAICPVIKIKEKYIDLAWFYFPEYISQLQEYKENPSNTKIIKLLEERDFHSYIIKESNKSDLPLTAYALNENETIESLQERIEIELIEKEHDLWIQSRIE